MKSTKAYWKLVEDYFGDILPVHHYNKRNDLEENTREVYGGSLSSDDYYSLLDDHGYQYDFNRGNEFMHYTSLDAALSIIKGRNIRMYNFEKAEDQEEIKFAANQTSYEAIFFKEVIESARKSTFYFSLCERTNVNNPSLDDEDSTLWNKFGKKGKGCCLVFSVANYDRKWEVSGLCKVVYGDRSLDRYKEINRRVREFNNNHPPLFIDLQPVFTGHKKERFMKEKEVRLLLFGHTNAKGQMPQILQFAQREKQYPKVDHDNEGYMFLELPIFHKPYEKPVLKKLWMSLPQLVLEEIILGYDLSEEEYEEATTSLHYLSKKNLGYMPEIKRSGIG